MAMTRKTILVAVIGLILGFAVTLSFLSTSAAPAARTPVHFFAIA